MARRGRAFGRVVVSGALLLAAGCADGAVGEADTLALVDGTMTDVDAKGEADIPADAANDPGQPDAPVAEPDVADDAATAPDPAEDPGTVTPDPGEPPEDVTAVADTTSPGEDTTVAVPDTTASPDAAADVAVDTGPVTPPEPPVLRFAAIGDSGKANDSQYRVGQALADKCLADGCDYVLMLGDNFYSTGVKGADDTQFQSKFEGPYGAVDATFLVTLGNHDYGGEGAGYELWKAQYYMDYAEGNPQFYFPDNFYEVIEEDVHLFALDSNLMMYGLGQEQKEYFPKRIAESKKTWKIAFGHHPYLSNGKHGNAGVYEGFPFIPIVSGEGVKEAYDAYICGKVDMLLAGHDHSRQWLKKNDKCPGTELIVSGAAASTTEIKDESFFFKPTEAWYQDADKPGFVWIEIKGNTLRAQFIDEYGVVDYTREITK